jgi:putative chitinase
MITDAVLLKIAPQADDPEGWAINLDAAALVYRIDPGNRGRMWLAQLAHETMGFTKFEESLNYSSPERIARIFRRAFDEDADGVIDADELEHAKRFVHQPERLANFVYADENRSPRNRLGNDEPGDGWKYRGRSPIHLTGKANYRRYGERIDIDLINFPDKALEPRPGSMIAGDFWAINGCNELADAGDFKAITIKINGGLNGWDDRRHWLQRIERIMT